MDYCISVMRVALLDRVEARAQEASELMAAMPEWDYP
jgi:hypothetical protein